MIHAGTSKNIFNGETLHSGKWHVPALFVLSANGSVPAGLDGANGRLALDDVAAGDGVAVEVDLHVVQLKANT